jgi:glucokinase
MKTTAVTTAQEAPSVARALPEPLDWSGILAQQGYVFGVDISGDGERVVLADLRGTVLGREGFEHGHQVPQKPDESLARIVTMMQGLLQARDIKLREVLRIGIGFGGPVDAREGKVRMAHDVPGWEDYPMAGRIESLLDVPTMLDNDARLAALGEMWFGAGGGNLESDLVYIHWSTGVGGGIVSGGRLLRGATTTAGEIGHTIVPVDGEALPCRCGGKGHLEAYVRSAALVERAQQIVGIEGEEAARLTSAADVFAEAGHDPRISKLVDEAVQMMAVTVGNLITSLNPNLVVIGGRVAREGTHLIPRIAELASSYAMPVAAREMQVVPATLGEDSTVMGAVALGLDSLR